MTAAYLSTASAPDYLAPEPQPRIVTAGVSGSNLTISGTNGLVNALYYVLSSTNVALPLPTWSVIATQRFNSNGAFSYTTGFAPAIPQRFYLLQVQ